MKTSGDIEADIIQLQKKARGFLKKENYEQAIEVKAELSEFVKSKQSIEKKIYNSRLLELGSAHYLDSLKNKKFRWDRFYHIKRLNAFRKALVILKIQ